MLAALALGVSRGVTPADARQRVAALIAKLGPLPPVVDLSAREIVGAIAHDKKIVDGTLHFVAATTIGATTDADGRHRERAEGAREGDRRCSAHERRHSPSARIFVDQRLVADLQTIGGARDVAVGFAQARCRMAWRSTSATARCGHVGQAARQIELGERVLRRRDRSSTVRLKCFGWMVSPSARIPRARDSSAARARCRPRIRLQRFERRRRQRQHRCLPSSRQSRSMKCRARIGMSSGRSRSGGTVIGNTDSRKYRSSRNCRAATACFRCDWWRRRRARRP